MALLESLSEEGYSLALALSLCRCNLHRLLVFFKNSNFSLPLLEDEGGCGTIEILFFCDFSNINLHSFFLFSINLKPVSWLSLLLLIVTGGGIVAYYDREKKKHIEGKLFLLDQ